ncbi:MAG: hypothetical protein JWQ78_304 [Sediminibacterium sp.]|nr:hypothetical protein [Sediminibacterium sp.]
MRKIFCLLGCCCFFALAYAQENEGGKRPFRHELSFTTDNDAFLLQKHDAFYTNGFFIKLGGAGQRKGKKIIRSWELGQKIYTPFIRKTQTTADIDRPYCGYLFLQYNQANFLPKESVFQYGAALGMVGPASLGEGMQNSYHRLLRYARFTGWQYQVQNALGIDLGMQYARTLWPDSRWVKFIPTAELNLGTTFTNARLGMYGVVGHFEKNSNSALWNARIQNGTDETKKRYELFAYWRPQVILQGYNATVEGGLFHHGDSAVLSQTERWMFQQNWGICYAAGQWTTRLELVYQTREATTQKESQQYGSIQVSYRIH